MPFDPTDKGNPPPYVPGVSHIIPTWSATPAPVAAATLRASASRADRQQTVAGDGAVLPIIYGQDRIGGQYAGAVVYGTDLWLLIGWCVGEIDSFVSVEMYDAALPAGVVHYPHLGTSSQTVDTNLQTVMAALSRSYSDALPYACYSVFKIPAGSVGNGFPTFAAVIKGMKVALTEGGTPTWTDNPVQCAADFVTNSRYGMGLTVDWATVATAKAHCEAMIGSPSEKRRTLNLTMANVQPVGAWLETLRAYCGCILNLEAGKVQFIVDTTTASTFTFTADKIVRDSLRLSKAGTLDTPTVVSVRYTNTDVKPYRDETVTIYKDAGVLAGSTPWRESQVSLPGINRYSQARREGIQRMNAGTLCDLSCQFTAFDPALKLQVGDVFTVTHPIGLTAKAFRCTRIADAGYGRYSVAGIEYDAAVYDDTVVTVASTADTSIPSPGSPPTPGAVTLAEEVYQLDTGIYASRIRATWATVSWPFLAHYRITVTSGGVVIDTSTLEASATAYATPAVREGVSYLVALQVISTTLAAGTAASNTLTPAGKTLIPGDVPTLIGFEAGGKVFLYWGAAADLDIWRYEIRYGTTGGTWDDATVVDVVDALTYQATGIPAGDWKFHVKAIDSVRQYSTTSKTLNLTVTLDAGAFLLGTQAFDDLGAPTLTSMTAYTARPDAKTYYATDFGDGVGYGADNTNNSIGTFGDSLVNTVFAHPHTAGTSKYVTQSWDMGQSLTGNFTGSITYTVVSGSVSYWLETSPDDATWTQWTGGSAKTTCRYVRLRLEAATTSSTFIVESGSWARVDAYPREENGTIAATAGVAATVTLDNKYASAKSVQLTAKGSTSRQAIFDNVVLSTSGTNSFDVWLFNQAGTSISGDVSWLFQGI